LIGEEAGVALSMLLLANLFLASLVGGMIYAASPQFKFRPKHEAK
jgi:hypothetical protein